MLGGLIELARAAGRDLRVERARRSPLAIETRAACDAFGIDPYWALSEGTLIATVRPERLGDALESLAGAGIAAAAVGEVVGAGVEGVAHERRRERREAQRAPARSLLGRVRPRRARRLEVKPQTREAGGMSILGIHAPRIRSTGLISRFSASLELDRQAHKRWSRSPG